MKTYEMILLGTMVVFPLVFHLDYFFSGLCFYLKRLLRRLPFFSPKDPPENKPTGFEAFESRIC
jgi:hypothetical protein